MAAAVCPDAASLQRFLLGQLPEDLANGYVQHLAECQRCVQTLNELKLSDTLLDALRELSSATVDKPISNDVETLIARFRRVPEEAALKNAATQNDQAVSQPLGEPTTATEGSAVDADATAELLDFLSPAESGDEIGRLGLLRILKVLGKGGMGMVFLAEDIRLGRRIAIKTMMPSVAKNATARKRFLREAKAMAAFKNDHVATVHLVDEANGIPFIGMELLEGENLEERLKRVEKLPVGDALQIARQVARGLAGAHAIGLIHRDIKPSNIWLEQHHDFPVGRAKIVDFGLARAVDDNAQLTQQGVIVGTPAYMAPEQASATAIDHRCDLFSLGCVLYRMTTGQSPFRGKDVVSTLVAVASEQPTPPCEVDPSIGRDVSDFIMKLLAKQPDERPASAQAVVETLQRLEREQASGGRKPPVSATIPEAHEPTADQTESLHATPKQGAYAPRSPSRRKWLVAAAVLLVLGPLSWFYGGTVIRFATNKGELVIETDDKNIEVTIKDGQVAIFDKTKDRRFLLTPGDYDVEVREEGDGGVRFKTKRFTIVRGGKETLQAHLELARLPLRPKQGVADPDRRAAEWVLSVGGAVQVNVQELNIRHDLDIKHAADLPREPFRLTSVFLTSNRKVNDAGLAIFKDCKNLIHLHLSDIDVSERALANFKDCKSLKRLGLNGKQVKDAWLVAFKDCKRLEMLDLSNTAVNGAGLAYLKDCKDLSQINLSETQVNDVGIVNLKELKNLTQLSVQSTPLTDAGLVHFKDMRKLIILNAAKTRLTEALVQEFAAALPKCKIESDYGTFGPATDADRRVAAWSNRPVSPAEIARPAIRALLKSGMNVWVMNGQGRLRQLKAAEQLDDNERFQGVEVSATPERNPLDDPAILAALQSIPVAVCTEKPGFSVRGSVSPEQFDDALSSPWIRARVHDLVIAIPGDVMPFLAHLRGLSNLHNLGIDEMTDAALKQIATLPKVTTLQIGHNNGIVTSAGLAALRGSRLKHLELHASTGIDDAAIEHLATMLELTSLDIRRTRLTAAGVKQLAVALPHCKIQSDQGAYEPRPIAESARPAVSALLKGGVVVQVHDGAGKQRSLKSVEELSGNARVHILEITATPRVNPLGDANVLAALKGLAAAACSANPSFGVRGPITLEQFRAAIDTPVMGRATDAVIAVADPLGPFLALLPRVPNLKHLVVEGMTDDGLQQIAALPKLSVLQVGGAQVSTAGLAALHGRPITWLNIGGCTGIDDTAIEHLSRLPMLTQVTVSGTKMTAAGVKKLAAARPDVRIEWTGGTIEPKRPADIERQIANFVLSRGGRVGLFGASPQGWLTKVDELPQNEFAVQGIGASGFSDRDIGELADLLRQSNTGHRLLTLHKCKASDASLDHLQGISLDHLYLSDSPFTDECLPHVTKIRDLGLLVVTECKLTDRGMATIGRMKELRDLQIGAMPIGDDGLEHLAGLKNLSTLTVNGAGAKITNVGLAKLRALSKLSYLRLSGNGIGDGGLSHIRAMKGLNFLALSGTGISDAGIPDLAGCAQLTHLEVRSTKLSLAGVKKLAAALSRCRIESDHGTFEPAVDPDRRAAEWVLSIGGFVLVILDGKQTPPIRDAGDLPRSAFQLQIVDLQENKNIPAKELRLENLAGLAHLHQLNLGPNATDESMAQVAQLKTLAVLTTWGAKITDAGFRNLQGLRDLYWVKLSGAEITNEGLVIVRMLPKLERLEIQHSQVGDGGVKHFLEARNLRVISLGDSKITDAGLENLATIVSLQDLKLNHTGVSDAGLAHVKKLPNLQVLELRETKVTAGGVKKLAAALPKCRIESDHGTFGPGADPDRRAAEWVLLIGGAVEVDGKIISSVAKLPTEPFRVYAISFPQGLAAKSVDDAAMEKLSDVKALAVLDLFETGVTDRGVKRFSEMEGLAGLQRSNLARTQVTDESVKHLQRLDKLWDIGLNSTKVTDVGLRHLGAMLRLRTLQIGGLAISDAGLEHLAALKELSFLVLGGCPKLTEKCLLTITRLPALEHLNLNGSRWLTDAGLLKLQSQKQLRYLELGRTEVSAAAVKKLAAALPQCKIESDHGTFGPTMPAAGAPGSPDADRAVATWVRAQGGAVWAWVGNNADPVEIKAQPLPGPFHLQRLELPEKSGVVDKDLVRLVGLTKLRIVNLNGSIIGDDGAASLGKIAELRDLHLSSTRVGDLGLSHLKKLAQLRMLNLAQTRVSDAGLAHLSGLENLENLNLHETAVGDAGVAHLAACINLRELFLTRTKVTDAGLPSLAKLNRLERLTQVTLLRQNSSDFPPPADHKSNNGGRGFASGRCSEDLPS